MLSAPRLLPNVAPVRRTAKVWPVIGTVVVGILMAIWATTAVKEAKLTIRATSLRKLAGIVLPRMAILIFDGREGKTASARVTGRAGTRIFQPTSAKESKDGV